MVNPITSGDNNGPVEGFVLEDLFQAVETCEFAGVNPCVPFHLENS